MSDAREAIIVAGTVVEGTIIGNADVRVEGVVNGKIILESNLVVASEGTTAADIQANSVFVEGKHSGNIEAKELIQIAPEGQVKAELKAPAVSIEKGAKFSGQIDMFGD